MASRQRELREKWCKRLGLRDIKQSIWKGLMGGPIYGTSFAVYSLRYQTSTAGDAGSSLIREDRKSVV